MLILKKTDVHNSSTTHDDHLSETWLTGLNILLILLAHPNLSFCGQASIRIQSLLNCRPLNGREEAAYLLSSVNNIFLSIVHDEDSGHSTHLLPLMNAIVEKSYELLQMDVTVPTIPLCKPKLDDSKENILPVKHENWQTFIQQITEPYADHYRSMSVRPFQMNMKIWWNNCHEMMTIAMHKRNRQIGIEKLKFQVRMTFSNLAARWVRNLYILFRIILFNHGNNVEVWMNNVH
jgi:hypothetical protein